MRNFDESIKKYAKLALEVGINLKENEGLIISVNEYGLPLARELSNQAYALGAKHVEILFNDDAMILGRYDNARDFVFENYPKCKVDYLVSMYENNYHHMFIHASNPDLLKDLSSIKINQDQKVASSAMERAVHYRITGRTKWCIIAVPCPAWASAVFPGVDSQDAVELLWEKIFEATRVKSEDPVEAWKVHDLNLKKYRDFLNDSQFEKLILTSPGTDLEVYLAYDHCWIGGSKTSSTGDSYVANIPTEEVFTTPFNLKVNGTLKATKPLSHNGKIVDDFGFVFKDGKVVDFYAGTGKEVLSLLLDNDEGSSYLGEVALVPFDSPISNTRILFKNTLFDENASVHFALGRAYPYAINNGTLLTPEELISKGANYSINHVDFMVGGPLMNIAAYTKDGNKVDLFKDGNWCI